jgi:hypothetical protein
MSLIRTLVTLAPANDLKADWLTNTVYHNISSGLPGPGIDYNSHAQEVGQLFGGLDPVHGAVPQGGQQCNITTRVYDMSDPHTKGSPRPERGFYQGPSNPTPPQTGPRQVACVLTFYATRNLPRSRGRIYLGPILASQDGQEFILSTLMASALTLGHGLFDIGGENVAHVVWSSMDQPDSPAGISGDSPHIVSDYWVDNSWDIVRRRKVLASTRQTLHP